VRIIEELTDAIDLLENQNARLQERYVQLVRELAQVTNYHVRSTIITERAATALMSLLNVADVEEMRAGLKKAILILNGDDG